MNTFGNWTRHDVDAHNQRVKSSGSVGNSTEELRPPAGQPAESGLHDYILEFWHARGWLAVHSRMDRKTTQAVGTSDFILVCPKTVAFVECKRAPKKPTSEQLAFLAHVRKMGWPNAIVYSIEEFHNFIDPLL
jgi:hypothetical protein